MGVLDQLEGVPVTGHHHHVAPAVPGLGGQGGQHVVGLVAHHPDHRDVERGQHLADELELGGRSSGVSARPAL